MINKTKKYKKLLYSTCVNLPIKEIKHLINKKYKNQDGDKLKISIIVTSRMNFNNKTRKNKLKTISSHLRYRGFNKLGLNYDIIDCSPGANLNKFKETIINNKIILICGGDTLYLAKYLKKTGMDKVIKKEIKKKDKLFIGCSAGAIVAGKTINPAYILRKLKFSKDNKAMNLINKNLDIIPHCSNRVKKNLKFNKYSKTKKLICLKDGKKIYF